MFAARPSSLPLSLDNQRLDSAGANGGRKVTVKRDAGADNDDVGGANGGTLDAAAGAHAMAFGCLYRSSLQQRKAT